mmetsp:Transcript_17622/g.32796  ORF Transcript_17622/g.32796 Transcript_17622/m.32796 type:complete len:234 (-) Transcript_17622:441-1142(-)
MDDLLQARGALYVASGQGERAGPKTPHSLPEDCFHGEAVDVLDELLFYGRVSIARRRVRQSEGLESLLQTSLGIPTELRRQAVEVLHGRRLQLVPVNFVRHLDRNEFAVCRGKAQKLLTAVGMTRTGILAKLYSVLAAVADEPLAVDGGESVLDGVEQGEDILGGFVHAEVQSYLWLRNAFGAVALFEGLDRDALQGCEGMDQRHALTEGGRGEELQGQLAEELRMGRHCIWR